MAEDVGRDDRRKDLARMLLARICCLVGLLLGVGGIVIALLGNSVSVSPGAVGAGLGILGYFFGVRRLGVASIVLGVAAVFFIAAVSSGLIPGITPPGHGYE